MKFLLGFVFFIFSFAVGAASSANQLDHKFVVLFLKSDTASWKMLVDSLRKETLYEDSQRVLLFAEYGLIGYYIGEERNAEAGIELALFEQRINRSLKMRPHDGELYAFYAATVAFHISLNPVSAFFLSSRHRYYLQMANQLSPLKGLPQVELANSFYFRPTWMGGDKAKAVMTYEKAFEYYTIHEKNHWMYFYVGAWLGNVYRMNGEIDKARRLFELLLREAPGFKWVKEDLLPRVS
jgi:tetratricopeptide (TPR) repeat protein